MITARTITVGVDIGQARDPSAIIALDSYHPDVVEDHPERIGLLAQSLRGRDKTIGRLPTQPLEHQLLHIERIPLGTPYPAVVTRIAQVTEEVALYGPPTVVVDFTGVGRAVVDMLQAVMPNRPLRKVTITGGAAVTQPSPSEFHVPKRDLVTALEVVFQSRRLKAIPGLSLARELRSELEKFRFDISARGNDTYEAASGHHDDLVLALALAVWHAERPGQGQSFINMYRKMFGQPAGVAP